MNLDRNKRLLIDACLANGIYIAEGSTPSMMHGLLLQNKVRRTQPPVSIASVTPASVPVMLSDVPNEEVYTAHETARIRAQYPSMNGAAVASEAAARWNIIVKSMLKGDEVQVEKGLVSEIEPQLKTDGWTIVLKDRATHYYRIDPVKVELKKRQAEYDEQDDAYDLSLAADHIKEEESAAITGTNAIDSGMDKVGSTRTRSDGRVEVCKSRQIVCHCVLCNGVSCKDFELYWELHSEVDLSLGEAPQMTTVPSPSKAADTLPSGDVVSAEHAKALDPDIITHRDAREKITNTLMHLSHIEGGPKALCELLCKMDDEQANDPDKKTALIANPRVMASKIAYTLTSDFAVQVVAAATDAVKPGM